MVERKKGMDSEKLSARAVQPGHDRTFVVSEENFYKALCEILPDREKFDVVDHPRGLRDIFGGRYGVEPEASITYRPTGRTMYFEVKKQGPGGNAYERAFKHHTVEFYKVLSERTGYDYHAFSTIFCESLATEDHYTVKIAGLIEPDHYFLWVDYKLDALREYVEGLVEKFLANPDVPTQDLPT